jgi:NitT/TauT family transport system ATP-binding protein
MRAIVCRTGPALATMTAAAPKSRLFDELEDYMVEEAAEQTLRTIISWGRYAELFAYDDSRQVFSLENPA